MVYPYINQMLELHGSPIVHASMKYSTDLHCLHHKLGRIQSEHQEHSFFFPETQSVAILAEKDATDYWTQ